MIKTTLLFTLIAFIATACPIQAQSPAPTAAPTRSEAPSPPPMFGPPVTSPAPPRDADATQPVVVMPSALPALPMLPTPSLRPEIQPRRDQALIDRLTPGVEIWRPNSNRPQTPSRRSARGNVDRAFVTGTEPVMIRLRFNPQAAGEQVNIIAAQGIFIDPSQQILTISPQGDCVFQAELKSDALRGHLIIHCRNVSTIIPLVRAPLRAIQAWEEQTGARP